MAGLLAPFALIDRQWITGICLALSGVFGILESVQTLRTVPKPSKKTSDPKH